MGVTAESASYEPLDGEVCSRAAAAFVGDAVPLCIYVARIAFCFEREEYERRAATSVRLAPLPV
jgi:hypothetical protein